MEEPRKIVTAVQARAAPSAARRWRFDAEHPVLRGPLQRPSAGGDADDQPAKPAPQ
jgi:hypothetical protein